MKSELDTLLRKANEALVNGRIGDASRKYKEVILKSPSHPDANHNMGILKLKSGDIDSALVHFIKALDSNPAIPQFWYSYIETLITSNQLLGAFQALKMWRSDKAITEQIINLEARLLATSAAMGPVRAGLLTEKPNDFVGPRAEEIINLTELIKLGKNYQAQVSAESLTKKYPDDPFAWSVLTNLLIQTDSFAPATHAAKRFLELEPDSALGHYNLGILLAKSGKLEEAESAFKQAIFFEPRFSEAHNNLGNTQQKLDRSEEASSSYREAIAIRPDFTEAHYNLGITLNKLNDQEESIKQFELAIATNSSFSPAYNELGLAFYERGQYEAARSKFDTAISLSPNFAEAYNNKGLTLQSLGELSEAERCYKKAISIRNNWAESIFNLSLVFEYQDKIGEAREQLLKLIKLEPDGKGLRAMVILAIFKFLGGRFSESRQLLEASAEIDLIEGKQFQNELVYRNYLLKILNWRQNNPVEDWYKNKYRKAYVVGESHCLVSHHLPIQYETESFLCQSLLVKGCKQWHLGNSQFNQYKSKFKTIISSIPKSSLILLAIGEIDCRHNEGIMARLNKNPDLEATELIHATVDNYLNYVKSICVQGHHQIIIQGVPCPNLAQGKISDDDLLKLSDVVRLFNARLKNQSGKKNFGFIDVHALTDRGDGLSNNKWHIDEHHLSPKGMMEAWSKYAYK